ncbi:MAG: hypothetical protein V7606_3039 [Burkholderiales bacterium]
MYISRYALLAFTVAVVSLFGLTQTGRGVADSGGILTTTPSLSSPNGLHVKVMREASNAYGARAGATVADQTLRPIAHSGQVAERCARQEPVSGVEVLQKTCIHHRPLE